MPAEMERCVKSIIEKQGLSEERAWAICKAADTGLLLSDSQTLNIKVDKTTGFLTAPVKLARTGVQNYLGIELGMKDRAAEEIGVFRSPAEVLHPDSIKSFINLVVTDNHPAVFVTIDNVKLLQKGQVSEVIKADDGLSGVITITDKNQIEKIIKGKVEVSVGYSNQLKKEKGTYDGDKYEFVQTEIRANHLAIVDAGRCGPSCKLTIDQDKKETIMFITIDGIQYNIEDAQLKQAIENQQAAYDAKFEKFKKKEEESEEEKKKLKAEKDKAEAEKDAVEKEKVSDADLNKLIADRAELLTIAKNIFGDKMPECTDCPQELKTAVVDHILPDMELDGKSKEYIDAAFDMAKKKAAKADKTLDKLKDDFTKDKDGNKITRGSARKAYMKDQLGLEE